MENNTIHCFLKFGKMEYMNRFVKFGEIYMNTISFYQKCDNKEIGDPFEGARYIDNRKQGKIQINNIPFEAENIRLTMFSKDFQNLFCLYHIENTMVSNFIDENDTVNIDLSKYKEFGDACVVIKNLPPFVERFENAITEIGLKLEHRRVEYFDDKNFSGALNAFKKSKTYEHQSEYRFCVTNSSDEPLKILIGNIEDCASIIPITSELRITFGK